jgi:hypothetical protein
MRHKVHKTLNIDADKLNRARPAPGKVVSPPPRTSSPPS